MKRILIINRTWNYPLPQLPKVDSRTWRAQWETYRESFQQRYLTANGQIDFGKLDFVDNGNSEVKDFILRTEFDLPKGLTKSHEEERENLLAFLRNSLMQEPTSEEADPVKFLYLFLFHNAKELAQDETFQQYNVRARNFGGGRAIIYGKKGLLGNDRKYFSDIYNEDLEVADEVDPIGVYKIIRPDNFNRVWDYYWSRTEERLRLMVEEMKNALIPGYYPERVKFAREFVNNFLTNIDNSQSPNIKEVAENGFYDFSSCEDLSVVKEILTGEYGKLHQEMERFAKDPTKVDKLLFEQHIGSFIDKVAAR